MFSRDFFHNSLGAILFTSYVGSYALSTYEALSFELDINSCITTLHKGEIYHPIGDPENTVLKRVSETFNFYGFGEGSEITSSIDYYDGMLYFNGCVSLLSIKYPMFPNL